MKTNVFPLKTENFYHIYNCGINGGQLFFELPNYYYFLKLVSEKVKPVAKIYSYCLLQNHFHILVKIRSEDEIRKNLPQKKDMEIGKLIGQQFANTFNSYTEAVNKRYARTGKLFELPFRRKEFATSQQLLNSILYINKNPVKHHISENFLTYPHSSIVEILSGDDHFVESEEVIALFLGKDGFVTALENYKV